MLLVGGEHIPNVKTCVLVVDDDEAVRESLAMALEERYVVVAVEHGQAALELLARRPMDVILLDLMMPVLDGEGFVAEANRRGLRVPIILMSAGADLRRRCKELGAAGFMQKPVSLDEVERMIDQVVAAVVTP
jgi:two-component system, OmpR family, response regulator MprA